MTLHCEMEIKNISLFLFKHQLVAQAATESYSADICNVLKFVFQTFEQYFWKIH